MLCGKKVTLMDLVRQHDLLHFHLFFLALKLFHLLITNYFRPLISLLTYDRYVYEQIVLKYLQTSLKLLTHVLLTYQLYMSVLNHNYILFLDFIFFNRSLQDQIHDFYSLFNYIVFLNKQLKVLKMQIYQLQDFLFSNL